MEAQSSKVYDSSQNNLAVTNHGVPEDVRESLFEESKAFFSLPEEVKLQSEVTLCSFLIAVSSL